MSDAGMLDEPIHTELTQVTTKSRPTEVIVPLQTMVEEAERKHILKALDR
jgi:hypothetical protein